MMIEIDAQGAFILTCDKHVGQVTNGEQKDDVQRSPTVQQPLRSSQPRPYLSHKQTDGPVAARASAHHTITALLEAAAPADEGVMDRLLPLVYDELRGMAHGYLLRERPGHTLSTTALVHEAYLKLVDQKRAPLQSRAYFFGAAARAMRQILVDHARHHMRQKRGGMQRPVTLEEQHLMVDDFAMNVLDLDEALHRLAELEPRAARVVECRFFGGISVEETAEVLGVSTRTVKRDWIMAKAWLYRVLDGEAGE